MVSGFQFPDEFAEIITRGWQINKKMAANKSWTLKWGVKVDHCEKGEQRKSGVKWMAWMGESPL